MFHGIPRKTSNQHFNNNEQNIDQKSVMILRTPKPAPGMVEGAK